MYNVMTKTFSLPAADEKEIWRYAGCKGGDEALTTLLKECLLESETAISPRACYCKISLADFCAFVDGAAQSKSVEQRLQGCGEVIIFAASVGLGLDRLMEKYAKVSPTKALLLQAIGAERIEALCEQVCAHFQIEYGEITTRFSAGYGDFPLSAQKDFFRLLDCPKKIGVSLTDALLMIPTKSVTAFVGIGKAKGAAGCLACEKEECNFRKE